MDKYIDAEAAIEIIEEKQKELCPAGLFRRSLVHGRDLDVWDDLQSMIDRIRNIPDADVAPVRHGRWEKIRDSYGNLEGWIHRECGREVKCAENFCPSCGAKMDGGDA